MNRKCIWVYVLYLSTLSRDSETLDSLVGFLSLRDHCILLQNFLVS